MGFKIKDIFKEDQDMYTDDNSSDQYYDVAVSDSKMNKMVLLEPRAYSEATQIADYLKKSNTVVLNLKRVTKEQAKRITDFVSGTIYAIGGSMQKIGGGTFLCAPKNVDVEGKITDEKDGKDVHNNDDLDIEW